MAQLSTHNFQESGWVKLEAQTAKITNNPLTTWFPYQLIVKENKETVFTSNSNRDISLQDLQTLCLNLEEVINKKINHFLYQTSEPGLEIEIYPRKLDEFVISVNFLNDTWRGSTYQHWELITSTLDLTNFLKELKQDTKILLES